MTNAELIVRMLRAAGVSHGFGIPSGNVLPLLEAMRVGGLSYVLTTHEGSAAFAADVKQVRRSFGLYGTDLGEQQPVEPPAHYFGVPAVGARSAAELTDALKQALATDHPTVIEAKVDPRHYLDTVYD